MTETNIFLTFTFFLLCLIYFRAERLEEGHLMGTEGKMMVSVHKEYSKSEFEFKREAKASSLYIFV
jgi:hypothetical protein